MNRFTQYLLLILVAFKFTTAFALVDISCLKYEPAIVTLIGILQARTYPGAPNFVSVETGDEPEIGYYLELRPPICTITSEKGWMLGHERISEVQLVMTEMQFDQLGANLGGVVSIKGSLFEAYNGHHHTPVLIDVRSFEGTEKTRKLPQNEVKPTKQSNVNKPLNVNKKIKTTKNKK